MEAWSRQFNVQWFFIESLFPSSNRHLILVEGLACPNYPRSSVVGGGWDSSGVPQGSGCCGSVMVDTPLQHCTDIRDSTWIGKKLEEVAGEREVWVSLLKFVLISLYSRFSCNTYVVLLPCEKLYFVNISRLGVWCCNTHQGKIRLRSLLLFTTSDTQSSTPWGSVWSTSQCEPDYQTNIKTCCTNLPLTE